jgi:hypothetical protein
MRASLLRVLGIVWLIVAVLQAARGRTLLSVAFACAAVAHLTRTPPVQWAMLAVISALVLWQVLA